MFPPESVASSMYAEDDSQIDMWRKLTDKGYALKDPSFTEIEKLSKDDRRYLLLA